MSVKELDSRGVAVITTTLYPGWYDGFMRQPPINDKLRGDLAINTIQLTASKGLDLTLIDGGSPKISLDRLKTFGVNPRPQEVPGMSGGRRQALLNSMTNPNNLAISWLEPEKNSYVADCLLLAAEPILEGRADVVIPKRQPDLFSQTYPDYQVEFEQQGNHVWSDLLRRSGLIPQTAEDFDAWFGPRVIKNDPELIKLFTRKYSFNPSAEHNRKIIVPERWPDFLFLPPVAALHAGYKVVSVEVPYKHPEIQTAFEQDSALFREKRREQYVNIVASTTHLIRFLNNQSDNCRLQPTA